MLCGGRAGHSIGGGIALCLLLRFIDAGLLSGWDLAGAVTFGAPLVLRSQKDNAASPRMLQKYLPANCRCQFYRRALCLMNIPRKRSLDSTRADGGLAAPELLLEPSAPCRQAVKSTFPMTACAVWLPCLMLNAPPASAVKLATKQACS